MTVSIAAALALSVTGAIRTSAQEPQATADALAVLEGLSPELSVAEADALLRDAYGDQFTPTERMRALAAAASVASQAGDHVSALAWMDWAVRETTAMTASAPDLVAETHAAAITIALAAEDPLAMRTATRAYAALEQGWADDPAHAALRLDPLGVLCPDVIDDRYVRLEVAYDAAVGGAVAAADARSARCVYGPVRLAGEPDALAIELYARRVWAPVRGRLRSVLEIGLDPADTAARAVIAERLPVTTTQVDREPRRGAAGDRGYVRYSRPGTDDVTAIAYALIERDGVLTAARVEARLWDWPPEALGDIAETVLASAAAPAD